MAQADTPIPNDSASEEGLCDEALWRPALHPVGSPALSLVSASHSVGQSNEELSRHAGPTWAPAGPGWFESSWILRRGLEVREIESHSLLEHVFEA